MRLSKFLNLGEYAEACFSLSMGWPRIAFHRGSAQYLNQKQLFFLSSLTCIFYVYIHVHFYTCIFIVYVCIYIYMYMSIFMYVFLFTCILYVHSCVSRYSYLSLRVCIFYNKLHLNSISHWIQCIFMYIYTYIHIY